MSVPDSRCIRVVTPDDHVNIGFHEILIRDLDEEEVPFVTLSELGCLRLDWPKTLLTFMSRYQFDLDQMRKECRERRMRAFLEESDAASLRRRHRRCARDIAPWMSRTSLRDTEDRTFPDVSS